MQIKLQALVYDILPSSTAVFSYAIGSRKLSANEQCFAGTQTVVSLLQTTQFGGRCRKAVLGVCVQICLYALGTPYAYHPDDVVLDILPSILPSVLPSVTYFL